MTGSVLAATIGVMQDNPDPRPHQRLRFVLDERERSELAHELHEHVAQALAAVLFGLDGLARGDGSEEAASRIAALRAHEVNTSVRSLDVDTPRRGRGAGDTTRANRRDVGGGQ